MSEKLQKYLRELAEVACPPGMEDRIVDAVRLEERRQRVIARLLAVGLALAVTMVGWSVKLFLDELALSPFEPLLKLAFTDSSLVLRSWFEWGLALAESLPAGTLALTVGSLWVTVFLLRRIIELGGPQHNFTKKGGVAA